MMTVKIPMGSLVLSEEWMGDGEKVGVAERGEDWDWYVKYQSNMKTEDLEKLFVKSIESCAIRRDTAKFEVRQSGKT